jgi:uncharacterized membrane protein
MMITWRLTILFIHVTAVIVALGGALFSTFALTPVLAEELEPAPRVRVARRIVRRLGTIVLTALGVLIFTGMLNLMYFRELPAALMVKLGLVAIVLGLALYQYGRIGGEIWRVSANGPDPRFAPLMARFRRVGLTIGTIVLIIVYLSLGLTRSGPHH